MQKNNTSSLLVMNSIILLLGMVLLTQFYNLLFHHVFSASGWVHFLNQLMQLNDLNSFQYQFIVFLEKTAPISTYLFAAGLFMSALSCIMLFARFYVCILVAIGFFIAWTLCWNDSGMWPFEFSFPVIFALLAGLSMRSLSLSPQSVFLQLKCSLTKAVLSITALSLALYYVTYIAFIEPVFANQVALSSAISFFIFCLAPFYILVKQQKSSEHNEIAHIDRYLDCMIISIGAMLILQVYINYFSGVFEITNFRESILYFAKNSNATWLHHFLTLNADYGKWILPIYAVFEMCLSVTLTLLLIRGPALLLAGGLLGLLAFSELGISATWPPDPKNLTWEWELLLVTGVAFLIGIQKTVMLKEKFSLKKLILGDPFGQYQSSHLLSALLISVISGATLYLIALSARSFIGNSYHITAMYSGITFAILIFILLITNRLRT